ncbi:hypothetical protein DV735_g3840, partial [Chaetothyriales sp. CBS 134920]
MSTQVSDFKALPDDLKTRTDIEHVLKHGYVIIPDCFTKEEAREARDEIDRLHGRDALVGRTDFEGLNTNRIYSLLNKSRVFDKFVVLPRVLALNDYFLESGYLINTFHSITINPGEKQQLLHHDDAFVHVQRPHPPFCATILAALDEFTAENGATRIFPGSHVWGSDWRESSAEPIAALVPEGGVVYFLSTLIHAGGANVSNTSRKSVTVQYCNPYIRQIENQILSVDPRKLREIDPRIVEMMGYRYMEPFVGHVEGLNPLRAAARLVHWLKGEVDYNPPTFPRRTRAYKL